MPGIDDVDRQFRRETCDRAHDAKRQEKMAAMLAGAKTESFAEGKSKAEADEILERLRGRDFLNAFVEATIKGEPVKIADDLVITPPRTISVDALREQYPEPEMDAADRREVRRQALAYAVQTFAGSGGVIGDVLLLAAKYEAYLLGDRAGLLGEDDPPKPMARGE